MSDSYPRTKYGWCKFSGQMWTKYGWCTLILEWKIALMHKLANSAYTRMYIQTSIIIINCTIAWCAN